MKETTRIAVEAIMRSDETINEQQIRAGLDFFKEGKLTPPHSGKLLSMRQAADRFGCTPRTVQRWIREGRVDVLKIGRLVRIPEESLTNFQRNDKTVKS